MNKLKIRQPAKLKSKSVKGRIPYKESAKRHIVRKNQTTQEEIDFCVNLCPYEDKGCNGNKCDELKKYLRGIKK